MPQSPASTKITKAILGAAQRRKELSSRVSFFKKVGFGLALNDDSSDKDKIRGLIQDLKYWNDALKDMLPLAERKFGDAVVNVRALALSENTMELREIGNAIHQIDGRLYDDISKGCAIKANQAEKEFVRSNRRSNESKELQPGRISNLDEMSKITTQPYRQLTEYLSGTQSSQPFDFQFPTSTNYSHRKFQISGE